MSRFSNLARLKRHLRICLDVGVFFMTYYCWVLVFVTASLLFKSWWQLFFHLALSSFLALILETCLRRQQCRIVSTFFLDCHNCLTLHFFINSANGNIVSAINQKASKTRHKSKNFDRSKNYSEGKKGWIEVMRPRRACI